MVIIVTRNEQDKTFFDKAVKFECSKEAYVNYTLPVGSAYQVEQRKDGLCSSPTAKNRVR
jgi:hypothetical protein